MRMITKLFAKLGKWLLGGYTYLNPSLVLQEARRKPSYICLENLSGLLTPVKGTSLVPSRKGLDTIALIKSLPALSSLKTEIGSDFKNCGIIFSIQDLANDTEYCSTALTKKTWEKGAKCINSFLHDKYFLKIMLSYKEKKNYLMTKVLSKIQHPAHSALCPEMTGKAIQISLNHFVFYSKNPPIPTAYAGLSVEEGGYDQINFHNLNTILCWWSVVFKYIILYIYIRCWKKRI